ncbi:MAG: carboxypeptidase-like regulatory domain-containing protein, partial [Verrucomicrobia bacterium]|nr:carboxypeptidase-like regulatory domain-containing protein [Prolixibacteraceae bacterium]
MKPLFFSVAICLMTGTGFFSSAQNKKTDSNIFGDVQSNGEHIPFASISLDGTSVGTTTDASGHYILTNLPTGNHTLIAKVLGYKTARKPITIVQGQSQEINFVLEEE